MQKAFTLCKIFFLASALLFSYNCKNNFDIPFPSDESEFAQPVSRPFHFSEPQKINWIAPNSDSFKPPSVEKFDLNTLPSRPFNMEEFKPLENSMTETKFDWNSLPESTFSLDSLPTKPLKFETKILGTPKIVKAELPVIKEGTSSGVLQFGVDQGLPHFTVMCMLKDNKSFVWIGTNNGLCRFDGENLEIYSTDQGLSDDGIRSLFEDKQGRIWAGHWGGVVELLDLKNGTIQKLITGIIEAFNLDITKFLEDNNGNMWITTQGGGVEIINQHNATIKEFKKEEGLSDNYVYDLLLDKNERIWISGWGLDIIDLKRGTIKHLGDALKLKGNFFSSLVEDKESKIWLASRFGGVFIVSLKSGTILNISKIQGLHNNGVWLLFKDSEGRIWMGQDSSNVSIYEPKTKRLKHLHLTKSASNNFVTTFFEYPQGQVWMGTVLDGIFIDDTRSVLSTQLTKVQGLSNNSPAGLLEDSKGQVWVGITGNSSPNGWVNIIDSDHKQVKYFTIGCGGSTTLNSASGFVEDEQGQIWVGVFAAGCRGGIDIINQKKRTLVHVNHSQGLKNENVNSLLKDRKGKIWIGTENTVELCDTETKTVKHIGESKGFEGGFVNCLLEDRQGQIWIGMVTLYGKEGAIYVIDSNREMIKHLTTEEGLSDNSINSLIEDEKGRIWAATLKGINVIDARNKTITTITALEGLADNSVYTLTGKNGNIYAGTENGLTVITPPAQSISTTPGNSEKDKWTTMSFGKTQGFSDANFNSNPVLQTKKGELWMNTAETINIINEPVKDSTVSPIYVTGVNIFDKPQTFISNSWINSRAEISDTIWSKDKDTFYVKTRLPTDTGYLKKKNIKWDSLTETFHLPVNLVLPYHQNFISFNFTGTHFDNRDKTRYRYILQGIDKKWSPISNKPFSDNYRDLPPGKYIFKVSGKSVNELWSQPAQFSFTILPPWWKTWWAYSLYILSSLIGLWSFIKWRERTLKREKIVLENKVELRTHELKKEKEKVESTLSQLESTQAELIQQEKIASLEKSQQAVLNERLRIGRELHDEVGATLSGIAMYSHLAKEQIKKATTTEVEKSLSIMQQSAGEMVNKLNDIVWLINPDQDSLQKLIQRLEEYARDMAVIKNMQVKAHVPEHLHEHSLPMESRRNIFLFCKEAINNAVKYSNGTLLELNIKEANNTLEFSVSDNGKGFDAVMVKRGNGLENMQKRADEIGAKLTVQSKQGEGALVSMQVKIT